MKPLFEVLVVSFKLGCTSFGGPTAHLGYFHNEYVKRRRWMDERSYADLVALAQFLPGPASSQVGIGIGILRAGWLGGVAAWIGFTMPSVILLVLFALLMQGFDIGNSGWIHGLKIVAVAIVAQAVLSMGQKLAPDRNRATLAILAAAITLLWQTAVSQILILLAAGGIGYLLYRKAEGTEAGTAVPVPISRRTGMLCLGLFAAMLIGLPVVRQFIGGEGLLALFESFYRSGSLVFGGGHVVLPLLEREVVPTGWMSKADFLAGYGATQAVPGPLFTIAAYLGAMISGVKGALVATVAIFLPAFLLMAGALPFWSTLRHNAKVQGALVGINAAVVGILLAALYNPLWITAVQEGQDFVLALLLFGMLVYWKLPPWLVVLAGLAGGWLLGYI
ncbi:chromate efflux transporter [Paenibacillus sp. JDR-2]|uniref:chromate efflux transporter n=1 Tax=Paenibacillus sp. (strain JDR-2) TaxID=324057 RepID=UPI0001667D85|nr:chromate efflux transporter [Paenibacillus sp. JDR-2]ACT01352.1 chromate transporter, chromate ion transporter (CHR) family [Paenibacillus sp. JDR-2]